MIDAFTRRHLQKWSEMYRPTSEDADTVAARMIVFLESMDADTRHFFLERGWTDTFDAMTEIEMRHAGESCEDGK